MDFSNLQKRFPELYPSSGEGLVSAFAPGRVNLIGEHTDYNNGYVLPCAISTGTWLLARKNDDGLLRFASLNFNDSAEIPIEDVSGKSRVNWVNYPLGVINQLIAEGLKLSGLDLLFFGNIPNSAGLSSSASIEVVTATLLNHVFGLGINKTEIVKLSQKAENEFIGVNCGIMDQFAVTINQKNHALFLNCRTLGYELVPLKLDGYRIVILNTGKTRQLAESKYNERVAECARAVQYLSTIKPISSLGELTFQEFVGFRHIIPDITIRKRAHHVVSENQRVLDAVNALKNNNLRLFGSLMNASHNSLRYNYEVTGDELDTIVEAARNVDGVLGARMTGAGFGGCAVSIVDEQNVPLFIQQVAERYTRKTGLTPEFYVSETNHGAYIIQD